MAPPTEGLDLNMLMNFRSELEKVGNMIVNQKQGKEFLKRAHILASINMLAANVPTCVVDHLGQEIQDTIAQREEEEAESFADPSIAVGSEDFSDASSDLSNELVPEWGDESAGFQDHELALMEHSSGNLNHRRSKRSSYHVRTISRVSSDSAENSFMGQSSGDSTEKSMNRCKLDSFLSVSNHKSNSMGNRSLHSGVNTTVSAEELGQLPAAAIFSG